MADLHQVEAMIAITKSSSIWLKVGQVRIRTPQE